MEKAQNSFQMKYSSLVVKFPLDKNIKPILTINTLSVLYLFSHLQASYDYDPSSILAGA